MTTNVTCLSNNSTVVHRRPEKERAEPPIVKVTDKQTVFLGTFANICVIVDLRKKHRLDFNCHRNIIK